MKRNDWRRRVRRLHFNLRRNPITFTGDEGKPFRTALYILVGLALLIVVALASREEPQLMASAEVLSLQDRGMLRVGVRYDVPGLGSAEGGLEHDLARLLAKRLLPDADPSASVQMIEVNAMTVGPKLDDGGIDVAIALASSRMATKYRYSIPYYSDPCFLVVLTGTPSFKLENMEVGAVQSNKIRENPEGALLKDYIAAHPNLGIKVKTYASYPDMLEALVRGKVRAVALTELNTARYAEAYPIIATPFSFGTVDYAICTAADSSALSQIGSLLLEELNKTGELLSLYLQHGLDPARMPAQSNW